MANKKETELPICEVHKTDCHAYKCGHCKCLIDTKLFKEKCSFYKNRHQAREEKRRALFYANNYKTL